MSAAAMNGPDTGKSGSMVGSRQQFKGGANGKAMDGSRKQSSSPVDGQNKKQQAPSVKAWQGVNPITQRPSSTSTPNGTDKPSTKVPHIQTQSQTPPKSSVESQVDKHTQDRTLFLLANFVGHDTTLTLKNDEKFTGVFSGASFDPASKLQYVLKMVKRTALPSHQQANGSNELRSEYIGDGDDHLMVFDKEDTVDLAVADVVTASAQPSHNGTASSSFRTDAQISARDVSQSRSRELQRWDAGPAGGDTDMSLGDSIEPGWDQFAANERLYGVQSTFDENLYTTAIDRTNPDYKKREADAARIASEIEGSAASDAHVAEERRRDAEGGDGLDEEEKYSGVKRDAVSLPKRAAGSYVPPSQRPITNAPTVPGAPFDPAIISLAKPAASNTAEKPNKQTGPADESVANEGSQVPTVSQALRDAKASPSSQTSKKPSESTTEDHVRNVTDSFKQFANNEKLRIRQAQEMKRNNQRAEKNVKLNDLKKFAENFKLKSRVPDDLVPILAKDREKQMQIQTKAEEAAKEEEGRSRTRESEGQSPATATGNSPASQTGASTFSDHRAAIPNGHRPRPSQGHRGPSGLPTQFLATRGVPGHSAGPFSRHGLPPIEPLPANLKDLHKQPPPLPPQQQPQQQQLQQPQQQQPPDAPASPSAASRFNANAKSFEFRPGANAFMPSGSSPSPQRQMEKPTTSAPEPVDFFAGKPVAQSDDRQGFDQCFNPLKSLKDGDYSEDQKKLVVANGGVPRPYQTPPTWPRVDANMDKSYKDSYLKNPTRGQGPSPLQTPNPNQIPHSHQLPHHMQPPPMGAPPQRQPYAGPPQHHPGHGHQGFDPNRMQHFGPNGSVHSSPRVAHVQMAFNNQMPGMQQFPGQQMPYPGVSPSMQYRQMVPPNAQGLMMGQPQGQMPQMPQGGYPRGHHQFPPQMMGGGVPMVQQPSQGFPGGPVSHPNGYSPMPPHAQPQMQHNMQHHPGTPGPGGYAGSPRPNSHMMQHSGSHQGFQPPPPMPHMQHPFPGNPGQAHPYYMQQPRFQQMTPRQQAAVPHHSSPGMGMAQGDEGK